MHLGGTLMEHLLEGRSPLRLWQVNSEEKICICYCTLLIWVYVQCLNRAIPSRKCPIKAPAKLRNSVHVLIEICHQRSKWLGPYGQSASDCSNNYWWKCWRTLNQNCSKDSNHQTYNWISKPFLFEYFTLWKLIC